MTPRNSFQPDPRLDLVLERTVDLPRALVWEAWTTPDHIKEWFTPAPWKTVGCEIDLRPGGLFRTVFRSPEGEESTNIGCYLEVVPETRLVWTSALQPGFRPAASVSAPGFHMTAIISLQAEGSGTKYTATVLHSDEQGRAAHEQMGFHEGWGAALDQLVALMTEK